ncbi:MAG TPA: alkaline phosphatase family protein [Opitutaceae bacterium]|nr:alkaline phosphatase family protein [Opitutaceae bacterium]
MNRRLNLKSLVTCGVAAVASLATNARAAAPLNRVHTVFYIFLENHNWIQPNGNVDTSPTSGIEQIKGNPAAPFINSLTNPSSPWSADVAYTNNCYNPLATPTGANPSIHPSEPNYLWTEAGSNYGVANDSDPYKDTSDPMGNVFNQPDISGLLQNIGISWKSYQEDVDLVPATGTVNQPGANSLTNTVAPRPQWTVPLTGFSGISADYTNPFNGSHQYNYAPKHNGPLFFTVTNGGTTTAGDYSTSNSEVPHYLPLQALAEDLRHNRVARYNLITPDQYNDMHTGLVGGFTYRGVAYTGDAAQIAAGDHFLSVVVPMIMASEAYRHNGLIVIWNDETERQNSADLTPNDYHHSNTEILISPLTKGHAYHNDSVTYTHSSDVETLQEIFPVGPKQGYPFIGQTTADTAGNRDYSDLFGSDHRHDDDHDSGHDR